MDSFNKFLNMGTGLNAALKQMVQEAAYDVESIASINAPVDTGLLASSIYTVTKNKSSYGWNRSVAPKKVITASSRKKIDTSQLLPEIDKPDDDLTAYVAVGAPYGVFVEFGTRFMAAQPYFFQAVETSQPFFEENAKLIEDKLREVSQ